MSGHEISLKPSGPKKLFALSLIVFWTFIAILQTSQSIYSATLRGGAVNWGNLLSWSIAKWYLWAAFTPLVLTFSRRLPIEKTSLKSRVPTHIGLALLIGIAHLLFETLIIYTIRNMIEQKMSLAAISQGLLTYTFHVNFFIYWAILAVAHALTYQTRLRDKEKAATELEVALTNAHLKTLKAQLQPHFLFNALHTILGLVLKEERSKAAGMLTDLSELLRESIDNAEKQLTSLSSEMAFINKYLQIQKTRFEDRLQVELDVDSAVLQAEVPTLLLQPLVENAIRHGIADNSHAGRVRIMAKRKNGRLKLQVADDGRGFPDSGDLTQTTGTGLANTQSRLNHLYPREHELYCRTSDLGGAEVNIEIPFRRFDGLRATT